MDAKMGRLQDRGPVPRRPCAGAFRRAIDPRGDGASVKAALPDHLAYQAQLEADGTLVFAGPMSDESGDEMQGMGLIVYRARSFDHARELAANDPMHKAGARSFTLRKWLINEGSLTLSVRLSGQTVALS